ncbi:arylsulfatase [Hypoxylon crocopeplum]|nr:arylsulfatase [Hypoxylon crocopeplum]
MGLLRYLSFALVDAKPNIILIFTDDQDLHLGSLDHMPILHRELIEKGTQFTNHYATVALCCPSRASLLRGQAAHNTNVTYVNSPGGNYQKFVVARENEDYLPHWLVNAGYNAEYLGKFMNGYTRATYTNAPKGWTHTDLLVDPFTYRYNNVVMSQNGETPISYRGFHQLDVMRVKALDRIDNLAADGKPFYLTIAPSTPHIEEGHTLPTPQTRHKGSAKGLQMSRDGNWNPKDEQQNGKPSWLKELASMNSSIIDRIDDFYRARIAVLQGVDEIIEDVVDRLDKHGILDNTYIIYTSDNGYHLGNHRVSGGKSLPYREDTNMPLIVRGPNVTVGVTSKIPSAHLDFAPTFLEIAGVQQADFLPFLDGRSLVSKWHNSQSKIPTCPLDDTHEIINVEFWGSAGIESPLQDKPHNLGNNSYKTLRIVGEETGYLYSKWCTNETELYDTVADPYELENLAKDPKDDHTRQLLTRLNALLLATKSCADQTCRNPWKLLQPEEGRRGTIVEDESSLTIKCLDQAMDPKYNDFFRDYFPQVAFQECKELQDIENERPYLPENPGLGMKYRNPTDNYHTPGVKNPAKVPGNTEDRGGPDQRNVTLDTIMSKSIKLTKAQLGQAN